MIILKQVIHDIPTNSVEATWVDRIQLPDTEVPESFGPTTRAEDGEIIPGELIPAHTVPGGIQDTQIKCHSYADVQMQMFRDDVAMMGGDSNAFEMLIAKVESNIKPVEPAPLPILSCSPWQIRKKLNKEGMREAVELYVKSPSATQDEKDAWEFATEFREDNPLLVKAASMLGITDLHSFIADAQIL